MAKLSTIQTNLYNEAGINKLNFIKPNFVKAGILYDMIWKYHIIETLV